MRLALREMRRSKVRFSLLVAAVAVLVWLVFLIRGLSTGLISQFIGALEHQSADVLVYGEQARKSLEGSVVTPQQYDAVVASAGPDAEVGRTVKLDVVRARQKRVIELKVAEAPDTHAPGVPAQPRERQ